MVAKSKMVLAVVLASAIVALSVVGYLLWVEESGTGKSAASVVFVTSSGGKKSLDCEVADQPGEWVQGLSGRSSLTEGEGMIFIFPTTRTPTFWMRDTLIPLDIIFINENGTVVMIAEAPTELDKPQANLTEYKPSVPIKWAVETNMGWCAANGIIVGSTVEIELLD